MLYVYCRYKYIILVKLNAKDLDMTRKVIPWIVTVFIFSNILQAADSSITIEVNKPGIKVSPTLWGIFFEDINLSADGGIYAELVRNRSFEDTDKPENWATVSSGIARIELSIDSEMPVSAKNPHSLKVTIANPGSGRAGVANRGYYGMSAVK